MGAADRNTCPEGVRHNLAPVEARTQADHPIRDSGRRGLVAGHSTLSAGWDIGHMDLERGDMCRRHSLGPAQVRRLRSEDSRDRRRDELGVAAEGNRAAHHLCQEEVHPAPCTSCRP